MLSRRFLNLHQNRRLWFAVLSLLLGTLCPLWAAPSYSQSTDTTTTTPAADPNALPQFFFDAKSTYFTRDGKKQVFEGDVIALGSKAVVTADTVIVDQEAGKIEAKGHVILISNDQVFTGENIEYMLNTGDFRLANAMMILSDPVAAGKVRDKILGLSEAEVEFEAKRQQQLKDLQADKLKLQNRSRALIKQGKQVPDDLIRDYALDLEREQLIADQKSPQLSRMKEEKRENLLRRRKYWNDARGANLTTSKITSAVYFKVIGESIERTNQNDFRARNSLWTPCYCEDDETPAWAFRSSSSFAQIGGYATFYNPILEVKGIPVLYLPYLKVPIKDQRQSGFLLPAITNEPESGTIYSQPLFLDLGKNMDATLKTDAYEKRGTRVGSEFRYKHRKNSGFTLNVEAIRDRLWLEKKSFREDYRNGYIEGLAAAKNDTTGAGPNEIKNLSDREYYNARLRQRSYWETVDPDCINGTAAQQEKCNANMSKNLSIPSNVTRGQVRWSGNEFMTDRISLVSMGEMVSDRFYNSDLYVDDGAGALFSTKKAEPPFNRIENRIHLDYASYYLGLGSQFGDASSNNDPYEGQQLPYSVRARSSLYLLTPRSFDLVPIYAQVAVQGYRILEREGPTKEIEDSSKKAADPDYYRSLGSGYWRRAEANIVAPLFHNTIISVDHFSDFEARYIDTEKSQKKNSSIASYRTGFNFNLPIDGKVKISSSKDDLGEDTARYLQHVMYWGVSAAVRPSVQRRGPYAEEAGTYRDSVYFLTDERGSDTALDQQDFMQPYQLLTFVTQHRWKIFSRSWATVAGVDKTKEATTQKKKKETSEDRARRELLRTMDQSVKKFSDIISEDRSKWFVDRYQLLDSDYQEPLGLDASISYDHLKAQQRKTVEDKLKVDYQPWSPLNVSAYFSWAGWTLSNIIVHDIYLHRNRTVKLSLALPTFLETSTSYSYVIDLGFTKNDFGEYSYQPTTTKEGALTTSLTSPFTTAYKYGRRLIDDPNSNNREKYMQGLGVIYNSSSRCWSLAFSREKGYDAEEYGATYKLELSVIFMGNARPLPQMQEPFLREVRNYDEKS